jgi:hypothetical protein
LPLFGDQRQYPSEVSKFEFGKSKKRDRNGSSGGMFLIVQSWCGSLTGL